MAKSKAPAGRWWEDQDWSMFTDWKSLIGYFYSFRGGNSHIVGRIVAVAPQGLILAEATKFDSTGSLQSVHDAIRDQKNPFAQSGGNRLTDGTLLTFLSMNNLAQSPLLDPDNNPMRITA